MNQRTKKPNGVTAPQLALREINSNREATRLLEQRTEGRTVPKPPRINPHD
jgi:hypothetical protein